MVTGPLATEQESVFSPTELRIAAVSQQGSLPSPWFLLNGADNRYRRSNPIGGKFLHRELRAGCERTIRGGWDFAKPSRGCNGSLSRGNGRLMRGGDLCCDGPEKREFPILSWPIELA